MAERRILCLGPQQMTAFRWRGGSVHREGAFAASPPDAAALAAFADYLAAHAKSVFTLLVNVAAEGFQLETIPPLRGADRDAVIDRKLAQRFPATPYAAARSLGRTPGRRRDETLLLAALTAPAALEPWLGALRQARAAVSGLQSLPFVGETLLRTLKCADERCLLLTLHGHSLRQSYFERGRLSFSRLSPFADPGGDGRAQAFAGEAEKLRQYLLGQRQLPTAAPLPAVIVADRQALPAIVAGSMGSDAFAFRCLSHDECRRQLGLKTPPAGSDDDALFAQLVATARPAALFAAAPLGRPYRLRQWRQRLYGLGAATLLGCIPYAGLQLDSARRLAGEAAALAGQVQEARQRYDEIAGSGPPAPLAPATLRQVMARQAELQTGDGSPEPLYRDLSAALAGSPAIAVEAIDWQAAGAAEAGDDPETAPDGRLAAQLRGSVNLGRQASPRQIRAAFEHFVAALAANAGLETRVSQQPGDIAAGKAWRSDSEATAGSHDRAFALAIGRREPP